MNLKSQLNGLNRRRFDNKTERNNRKYLIDKYNLIGKEAPKYILEGKLTETKINRALKTLTIGINKAITREQKIFKGGVNNLYKEYSNNYNKSLSELKKEIRFYDADIQNAILSGKKRLIYSDTIIDNIFSTKYSKNDIINNARKIGMTPQNYIKELMKNNQLLNRAEQDKRILNIVKEIAKGFGYAPNKKDIDDIKYNLKHVGLLEKQVLIDRLSKKAERAVYIQYKEQYNINDFTSLSDIINTDISDYIGNRIKDRLRID